jgi:hypothetical protein
MLRVFAQKPESFYFSGGFPEVLDRGVASHESSLH